MSNCYEGHEGGQHVRSPKVGPAPEGRRGLFGDPKLPMRGSAHCDGAMEHTSTEKWYADRVFSASLEVVNETAGIPWVGWWGYCLADCSECAAVENSPDWLIAVVGLALASAQRGAPLGEALGAMKTSLIFWHWAG